MNNIYMNSSLLTLFLFAGGQTDEIIHDTSLVGIIIGLLIFNVGIWILYTRWYISRALHRLTKTNEMLSLSVAKYEEVFNSIMPERKCADNGEGDVEADFTELSRYQKELEESKHKAEEINLMLSSVLIQTPCAMFIKDVEDDYRYIVANKMFCEYQQKRECDVVGKTDHDIFSSQDAEKFKYDDEVCVANNTTFSFSEDVVWCGRPITWYTTKAAIVTSNGKKLLVGVSQDITESTKRQKELEVSKKKTDIAIAASGILPWEYDCSMNKFIVNEKNPLFNIGKLFVFSCFRLTVSSH